MPRSSGLALWWLPLACALLPVAAAHLAFALSVRDGFVPDCVPYWDGCASISRAGRHGLAAIVFKLLMLPCAVLQALHWVAARQWLALSHRDPAAGRWLLPLGLVAGIALAVYVAFLGSDGEFYRWMRRYGTIGYFAATYLAQLLYLRGLARLPLRPRAGYLAMALVCAVMLLLGLASTGISAVAANGDDKDRLENLLEWHIGLLLTAWFLIQARLWRGSRFGLVAVRD
jgi:hypothetical protein